MKVKTNVKAGAGSTLNHDEPLVRVGQHIRVKTRVKRGRNPYTREVAMKTLRALLIVFALAPSIALAQHYAVVVNRVPLDGAEIRTLQLRYGIRIPPGRYWYDRVSGVWGFEGGPAMGQILPGLRVGGPLRADASHGDTGVFVNGRELHRREVAALGQCTPVYRGRYWVNARGIGGIEGGPPRFNLAALCQQASGRNFGSRTWYNGDGSWSHHSDATGLGLISDGQSVVITGR